MTVSASTNSRNVSTFAIAILLIVLFWDAYLAAHNSRDTISNVISQFNQTTGGLVALAIAALWVHWFLPLPSPWMSEDFRDPRA